MILKFANSRIGIIANTREEIKEALKDDFIPHCKQCNRELTSEKTEGDTQVLTFGLCSACKIIETEFHPCGNCGRRMVAPGLTICQACAVKLAGGR